MIGAVAGLLGGGLLGYFGKCSSGTCPLTANPWRGALFGIMIGAGFALLITPQGCRKEASNAPGHSDGLIIQVSTAREFETRVLRADKPVLVDFYANGCPPCKKLAPIIEDLSGEYKDRAEFVKVDGDRYPQLRRPYNIPGYPTVIFFSSGKPVERLVGLHKAGAYRAALDKAIRAYPNN